MAKRPSEWHALVSELAAAAPNIALKQQFTPDDCFRWDGHGRDPKSYGYHPHDVAISAHAIVEGQEHEGTAYLGGSYYRPGKCDPDVNGYALQMVEEALDELPATTPNRDIAIAVCHRHIHQSYTRQRSN